VKMSNREASQRINKHYNFFSVMKCSHNDEYNHVMSIPGSNIAEKYMTYQNDQSVVIKALTQDFFWLEDNKLVYQFSKYIHNYDLFGHENSFATHGYKIIFNSENKFTSYKMYIKYIKILKLLIKFKKEHNEVQRGNEIKA